MPGCVSVRVEISTGNIVQGRPSSCLDALDTATVNRPPDIVIVM